MIPCKRALCNSGKEELPSNRKNPPSEPGSGRCSHLIIVADADDLEKNLPEAGAVIYLFIFIPRLFLRETEKFSLNKWSLFFEQLNWWKLATFTDWNICRYAIDSQRDFGL